MPILSDEECYLKYDNVDLGTELCAGRSAEGKNTCQVCENFYLV